MKFNYFSFRKIKDKILLTNDLGRYVFVDEQAFRDLVSRRIDLMSPVGRQLLDAGMVYEGSSIQLMERAEHELREAKAHLVTATSLHIFVVTTSCNLDCVYCQANNGTAVPNCMMSADTAEKAVDIALQSPEESLSFEFQGGEPLLNFDIIKHIIEYTQNCNTRHKIDYNIVTNLTMLTDEMIDFIVDYKIGISTSLDGDCFVHNTNRPYRNGGGTYETVVSQIEKLRERGINPGAIETTTRATLKNVESLVDTYIRLGFDSVFIRHLTQLGKASKGWESIGYTAEEFLTFYRQALDLIIKKNIDGIYFREQHASILLNRIMGNRMNYMELRSPCGGGIGQLAYFADGRVFTCDEGRMLAEMGNSAFQLGDVYKDTYKTLVCDNRVCRTVCAASTLETIPSCCDCVYQPYCGTCPVLSYAVFDDIFEKHPNSFRCKVYSGILDYLFELLLENNSDIVRVLESWSE